MGSSRDGDCYRYGVQELSYKGLTRAIFWVAKAQDRKDATKQRLSGLDKQNKFTIYRNRSSKRRRRRVAGKCEKVVGGVYKSMGAC